jgi:hypothetical protein
MRLASTVVFFASLGAVACQQIYDIVCVEDTCRLPGLLSRLNLFSCTVANDMGQGEALHLLPTHSRSDKFRDARRHW